MRQRSPNPNPKTENEDEDVPREKTSEDPKGKVKGTKMDETKMNKIIDDSNNNKYTKGTGDNNGKLKDKPEITVKK
jgi:hypothetical protein